MNNKSRSQQTAEQHVKSIRRATRKQYSAEEKIRIVIERLRGEHSIAELCRREQDVLSVQGGITPPQPSNRDHHKRTCRALMSQANVYAQSAYAELANDTWEAQIPAIRRTLSTNGGKWFWDNYGNEFEKGFRHEVERDYEQYKCGHKMNRERYLRSERVRRVTLERTVLSTFETI